jgi:DcmR-like sensory protein
MPLDFAQVTADKLAPARRGRGDHFVQLYAEDRSLIESVATFVGHALHAGDAAIIVGTEPHRRAIAALLGAAGLDLDELSKDDRFFSLDAGHTLATFSIDGRPNEARFASIVGGLVERAAGTGRRVRVFGEMVALLWDAGDVASAIELEEMWNRLAERRSFDLFCAYPTHAFGSEDESLLAEVCHRHSHVIPPV